MMEELWFDISNYLGSYQISNLGRVRSVTRLVSNGRNRGVRRIKGKVILISDNKLRGRYVELWKHNSATRHYILDLMNENIK